MSTTKTQIVSRFVAFPKDHLQELVIKALKGDASDDSIIRKVKRIIAE